MATIGPEQTITRVIKVYGIEQPVVLKLTAQGLTMQVKGSRRVVYKSWRGVAEFCDTPADVPSKHYGMPIALLEEEAKKITEKLQKKADKKETE